MSQSAQPSPLHNVVHQRFEEVFGEPDHTLGRDDHWALQPAPAPAPGSAGSAGSAGTLGERVISINVLVDGMPDQPAVWVFDPYSRGDGVMRVSVKDEAHLEEIITQIQERLKIAGKPRNSTPG